MLKWKIPERDGLVIMAVDTHQSIPHAILWVWVDFKGIYHSLIDNKPNLYEVAAIFEHGTIPEIVDMINAEEQFNQYLGRKHDVFLLEPGAWNTDQTRERNEKSIKEQFEELGLFPEKGSKDLMGGLHKVRELLTIDEKEKHPRLMTLKYPGSPGMEYLLKEKRSYSYPDPRNAIKRGHTPSQKPIDKDDHMMENERRIVEYVYDKVAMSMLPLDEVPIFAPNGDIFDVSFKDKEIIPADFM